MVINFIDLTTRILAEDNEPRSLDITKELGAVVIRRGL